MTYGKLQNILKVFLFGDTQPPKDGEVMLVVLETAYLELANDCTALKLLTASKDADIIRTGPGSNYVRLPKLPKDSTDRLDIDSELVPAAARLMASYIAKDLKNKMYHKSEADKIIKQYESKVRLYMQQQEAKGVYDPVFNLLPSTGVIV